MAENSERIIYSMVGVTKRYDKNVVLNGVNLSYFYGAKIGVLGTNGAGKSSLLRILAGVDKEFEGDIQLQPGYRVGYLPQEPKLDPDKTVMETVREAVKPVTDLMAEYDAINEKFGEEMSDDDMDALIAKQGEVQEKLEHMGAWEIDSLLEMAMDALRCPPGDALVGPLSGGEQRRVALCRLLLEKPDVLLLDEPTNHLDADSVGWLERHLQKYEGTVIAITHDRYFPGQRGDVDSGAGVWGGPPLQGQLQRVVGEQDQADGGGQQEGRKPAEVIAARTGMDGQEPGGAAVQEQGAGETLRRAGEPGRQAERPRRCRSIWPPVRGWARRCCRSRT